jgi:glycosyltransferase involved in cell wall biosynthesis
LARLYPMIADPRALPLMARPVVLALRGSPTLRYLPGLARYLRQARPDALFSATPHVNLQAIWARRLADVPTRILVSEHMAPSAKVSVSRNWRHLCLPPLVRHTYPMADAIVAVSDGVADDLARLSGLPRGLIKTVYNPVVTDDVGRRLQEPLDHPWFAPGQPPVILSAGRMTAQKDFPTLVRAFGIVRRQVPVRLLILGEGATPARTREHQAELAAIAAAAGAADDLAFPGFVANPYPYMKRAALFVLSSHREGFPNVLAEALAAGCPVVSTDCPSGPMEILDRGRFGRLVPVGAAEEMAAAMLAALRGPRNAEALQARAAEFSFDRAVDGYLNAVFGDG